MLNLWKITFCKALLIVLVIPVSILLADPKQPQTIKSNPGFAQGLPTILDLGSTTCIPCRMMAPILKKLERVYRGKAAVLFVDVNKNQVEARNFAIRTIPTQIFFDKNGTEVFRHEGFMDEASIVRMLDLLLQIDANHPELKAMMIGKHDEKPWNDSQLKIIITGSVLLLFVILGLVFVKSARNFRHE
jgi:thioredoxin 1